MEPENKQAVQPTIQPASGIAPLKKVTPVSKYLAMALFIILPFLGGYIGYTYAPEKVVELQKEVITEVPVETPVYYDQISRLPYLIEKGRAVKDLDYFIDKFVALNLDTYQYETSLDFLYYSVVDQRLYFRTVQASSRPSQIFTYDTSSETFLSTEIFIDFVVGGDSSDNGRYVIPEMSGSEFEVIDLSDLSTTAVSLLEGETLVSGVCGYAGAEYPDVVWGDDTVTYSVYDASSIEEAEQSGCGKPTKITERTLELS